MLIFLLIALERVGDVMAQMARVAFGAVPLADELNFGVFLWQLTLLVAAPLPLLLGIVFGTVLLLELLQTGFVFSAQPLRPDFSKLNPAKGLKRLFSVRLLIEALKNVAKLAIYGFVVWLFIEQAMSVWSGRSPMDDR